MRTLFISIATCGALGCGALDFDVERPIPEQRVPGSVVSAVLGDFFESPIPIDVDIASETAARDTGPADSIHLTVLELSITDTARPEGDEDDFGFIDRVDVFVESSRADSTLPRVKVAELGTVQYGATELSLDTFEDVDLLPYVEEGARMNAEASGTAPPDDVTYDGRVVLTVEVL